ncbi:50S ribosomal protein L30 [bacterium]|jgi:large subunit ribosomal protein L30|nr:50S ribosomal protein L30 [bacterium]NBX71700.1 50S ribosomal protein L30 [bacterium]
MKQLKIKLVKSLIGRLKNHQDSVRGLGLRKINHTIIVNATPENLGMINQVRYLLLVEEI